MARLTRKNTLRSSPLLEEGRAVVALAESALDRGDKMRAIEILTVMPHEKIIRLQAEHPELYARWAMLYTDAFSRRNPRARRNGALGTMLTLASGFGAGVFAEKKLGLYDEFKRRQKQSAHAKAAPKAAPVTDSKWRTEREGGYVNYMRSIGGVEYIVFKSKGTKSLYYAEYIPVGSSITKRIAGPDQLGRFLSKDDAIEAAESHAGLRKTNPRTRRNGQEVAQTILKQMGGTGKLAAMIGAKDFIAHPNGVAFKFMDPGAGKPNYVKIILNARDTYDVEFGRLRGMNYKVIKSFEDIYNDSLRSLFERTTGLYLSL